MHRWSRMNSKNEFEPYAEYSLHATMPPEKLGMVLLLTTTFFVLGCLCVCLLNGWRTFVFGRGLIIPQELRRSCDCKMNWNLPGGHNVSSNMRCLIISSGQSHVGCCSRVEHLRELWVEVSLWLGISSCEGFLSLQAPTAKLLALRAQLAGPAFTYCPSAWKTCSVVLRYLDIFEESWVDFSQEMPKGIVS